MPLNADDYAAARLALDFLSASGGPASRQRRLASEAFAALDRIAARHRLYLDACARATDLANVWRLNTDVSEHCVSELRRALGDGYLGGPLLGTPASEGAGS